MASVTALASKFKKMKIKANTMKRLWAVAHEYGLSKEDLHNLSISELNREHISTLNEKEARFLIDRIQGKATVRPSPRGMASNEQKKYINDLAQKLGWNDNPARLAGFIKKYAKTDSIDWVTSYQASKIIEGLKKMAERV